MVFKELFQKIINILSIRKTINYFKPSSEFIVTCSNTIKSNIWKARTKEWKDWQIENGITKSDFKNYANNYRIVDKQTRSVANTSTRTSRREVDYDKNEEEQYESVKQTILNDESLSHDEKLEAINIISKNFDGFKNLDDEGTKIKV
ncbi:hypothetical protein RhiirA1_448144 [Rhizophagus irregularis]|uniref:Uncharacterized protein n=1 Tax=Rhizophagus irregularis TaxID=588596 RepID=A0A2N0SK50_9GLOM|nr:hypothetical protein RhiirA1_448144 [Rhizophagus irregularis]